MEPPPIDDGEFDPADDGLGCARGVINALLLTALVVLVGRAAWLWFVVR